jgi:diacylglycerol O-acyltransferase
MTTNRRSFERLSAMDASFLQIETPINRIQLLALFVFEGPAPSIGEFRAAVAFAAASLAGSRGTEAENDRRRCARSGRVGHAARQCRARAGVAPEPRSEQSEPPHALVRFPLADMRETKAAYGTTINNIVLAAATRALDRCFARHGDTVPAGFHAAAPVSIRVDRDKGVLGNKVALMYPRLPAGVEDRVRDSHARVKASSRASAS